jgi:hypothetical protein
MYWQLEYLREGDTMARNATYRLDLPENGMLSAIQLRIEGTAVSNAFLTTFNYRVIDFIDKIEIIGNGSTIIKSITGNVLQALQFYDTGIASLDYTSTYGEATARCNVMLLFGRHLFDTVFGLDLSQWTNIEIRITNSATSTYYKADFTVALLCYWMRDGGGFSGYLRTEEWQKWTTVSDETKYLELPTENKIRRVIFQCIPPYDTADNTFNTGMWNMIDDLEVSLKTGVLRIYKGGIDDLMRMNAILLRKLVMTYPQYYMTNDYSRYIGIGYVLGGAYSNGGAAAAITNGKPTLEVGNTNGTQTQKAYGGDTSFQGIHVGLCPENCLLFPFNLIDEPESYLDVNANATVKMNVHTRSGSTYAGGTIRVILDRVV